MATRVLSASAASFALWLLACGGGGGSDPAAPRGIGGAITGLDAEGLVLRLNGAEELTIPSGASSFQFKTLLVDGEAYTVTFAHQPGELTCSFDGTSGQGVVHGSSVEITIGCSRNAFHVRGVASGLSGPGLVLGLGDGVLTVDASGPFAFPDAIASGTSFEVSVKATPAHQDCEVTNGSGRISGGDVTDVAVTCHTRTYHVGGSVSGLAGSGLELSLNGRAYPITQSPFTLPDTVAEGSTYTVAVTQQPSNPAQLCSIGAASSGSVSADVTLTVACSSSSYHVSGLVSGLSGPGLVLGLGGEMLPVDTDGTFAFPSPLASGSSFAVAVAGTPAHQDCEVTNGSGQISSADVTEVAVTCHTRTYHVGGSVSGLAGSGLELSLNGRAYPITQSPFTLPDTVAEGSTYTVAVTQQPSNPAQLCSIGGATSDPVSADVTLTVACWIPRYSVGGRASGMSGPGLVLLLDGEMLPVGADGYFVFETLLASGMSYTVLVASTPDHQDCEVASGRGTITSADVTSVAVTCH